jgi:hypothetical protein
MQKANTAHVNRIAAGGLALGALFGLAGTLVTDDLVRQVFWAIDGVGIIVATALLAVRFARLDEEGVSAGFLVFALGETLLVGGVAGGLERSVPSFGGGVALWAAGLLLIGWRPVFAWWVRAAGFIAAALFVVVSGQIFSGTPLLPTASPLPFFAYPFLVLTFVGWIQALLAREPLGVDARVG